MLFAHLKRILRLDWLRLRGPNGTRDEFHLAAAAQTLQTLAKLVPAPGTSWPERTRRRLRLQANELAAASAHVLRQV